MPNYYNSCYDPCYTYNYCYPVCCQPCPPCPPCPPTPPTPPPLVYPIAISAALNGANEVPPNASTATGILTGSLVSVGGATIFAFALTTTGLANITAAHFHDGVAGVNGPIVKNIDINPLTGVAVGTWSTTDLLQPLTADLIAKLQSGALYVNVHTATLPGGEIRGQTRIQVIKV